MIGARDVVVFLARPEALGSGDDAAAILSAEDLAHAARFRFDRDRQEARASRALQRRALSACTGVPPASWQFARTVHGRPLIAGPDGAPPLNFNVANTRGLVACAVTLSREVGLDLEPWRDDVPHELVPACFAPDERNGLAALPRAAQPRRFVELWTLKEAYVKARGVGMSLPLERISLALEGPRPRLSLDASLEDEAGSWHLESWSPTTSHAAALCVRRNGDAPLAISSRWVTQ